MYQVLYYPYYKNNNYSKKRQIKHKRHYEQFADGTVKDIEDEIPFEVPEGWAWIRQKNLGIALNGKAFKP
ncbi:MAG: hypothetical protein UDP17_09485, partial [Treponema sp.]|nr:hypothetical protein [Treponema sp.]